jgi:ribosomal protein S12 methylthiotransferase accessory factor
MRKTAARKASYLPHPGNAGLPGAIVAARADATRICPMFAGPCLVSGNKIMVRTVDEEIEVRAPRRLLEIAFQLCDGSKTRPQILDEYSARSARPLPVEEFSEFLDFLFGERVLIDAVLACANANSYAFQRSPFGMGADPKLTNTIAERFSIEDKNARNQGAILKIPSVPLEPFFQSRESCYTFDDQKPPSAPAVHKLLWSIAGVVQAAHPRFIRHQVPQRTLPSAGAMHLLEVYVALQRAVGDIAPGIYRVEYPAEKSIRFRPVNQLHTLLPRAFSKPWQIKYATGAVFVVADPAVGALRYRNRSLQYLFMEAGAALHNAGLSAFSLGLAFATLGSYYEDIVSRFCELDSQLILGAAVFGNKPTPVQIAQYRSGADFDFAWVQHQSAQYSLPFYMGRAELKSSGHELPPTWGRDRDPWLAALKAQAEAVERLGYYEPKNIREARIDDLPGAIAPTEFVRYHPAQYADPDFPYQPFDHKASYLWTRGVDLVERRKVHVLADLVYMRSGLEKHGHAPSALVTQMTSSGCAAGTSIDDAIYRGLLELIERDAFIGHWLSQTCGDPIVQDAVPRSVAQRIRTLQAAGCRVSLQRLHSLWAPVALVAAQHEERHFTTMGTAAGPDFTAAAMAALDELEGRVFSHLNGNPSPIQSVTEVATAGHHFHIYGFKKHFRKADKVLFPAPSSDRLEAWPDPEPIEGLAPLLKKFAEADLRPIAVDITPKNCAIDQGRIPLSVAKVLVPGLLPMYFGYQREPLGMVTRVLSGSKFPHPFP